MNTAAVLTLSTSASKGEREDGSGKLLIKLLKKEDFKIESYDILPDDKEKIKKKLQNYIKKEITLVITSGGTGLSPSDQTPDALLEIKGKIIPGVSEALRMVPYLKGVKSAPLSRGLCVMKNKTVIVNFPGSQKAALESFEILKEFLEHLIKTFKGEVDRCGN